MEAELAALARLTDHPGKAVRLRDRRREGQRQDRRVRAPDRSASTPSASAAAWRTRFSPRSASTSANRCATTISSRRRRILDARQGAQASRCTCRPTRSSRRRSMPTTRAHVVPIDAVGDEMILDIGPATRAGLRRRDRSARRRSSSTARWASTKSPPIRHGTQVVGEAIARATRDGAISVVGGGDAAAAAHVLGFADADDARLDRRRRDARISRRQDAARRRRARALAVPRARSSPPTGRCTRPPPRRPRSSTPFSRASPRSRRDRRRRSRRRSRRLPRRGDALRGTRVALGAQTMHWELRRRVHRRDQRADAARVRRHAT